MKPLLINKSNISRNFSLQLSKRLADSDLAIIGLTGIEPIRKISVHYHDIFNLRDTEVVMCIILSLLKRTDGLSQLSKYKNVHVCVLDRTQVHRKT
jgi:hypothetical protein